MYLFIVALFFLSSFFTKPVFAETTVTDLENQINQYTQKLEELSKAKDTLANQIKYLSSQVELTLLKINQTETSIKTLETEIASLTIRIDKLDIYLNHLSSAYIYQIIQNYKLPKRLPFISLFTIKDFNSFLNQYKYNSVIQKNSRDTLIDMETARTTYDLQKQQKTQKQQELETLQKKLAQQKINLAQQKDSKGYLLTITKNNETKYQQLKKAAEDELNSLLKAKFVGKREVKKGESLGLMGNTGYSFGDHLHFGLYNLTEDRLSSWTYQNDIDSNDYLAKNVWPMQQPVEITQSRGHTKYSYLYSDRFHHGIDMVSPNKSVKTVNDGIAYFFRNASSSLGNHVKVFHSDGKMTLYLHLQ